MLKTHKTWPSYYPHPDIPRLPSYNHRSLLNKTTLQWSIMVRMMLANAEEEQGLLMILLNQVRWYCLLHVLSKNCIELYWVVLSDRLFFPQYKLFHKWVLIICNDYERDKPIHLQNPSHSNKRSCVSSLRLR